MALSVVILVTTLVVLAVHALLVARPPAPPAGQRMLVPAPVRSWLATPRNRWLLAAALVGLGVRLLWVTWATREPGVGSDSWEYLRTAEDLADGILPRFGGRPSAFYAPGYPIVLAPFAWFSGVSGWASTLYLASLVNAIAGASTVVSAAYLAARWISPRARNLAAWLMALAPAQIYWTSTQHAESVHTALALAGAVAITWVLRRHSPGPSRARWLVAVGLLVGLTTLTRTPGMVLLVVLVMAVRRIDGTWRTAGSTLAWTVLGALVVLAPATVRNGVEVGAWTPVNTSNATAVCLGNHPDAGVTFYPDQITTSLAEDCYRGSPYDDPSRVGSVPEGVDFELQGVDEAHWYRSSTARGVGFMLDDPVRTVSRAGEKLLVAYRDEFDALPGAVNYTGYDWGAWRAPLDLLANLWLWSVLVLAALGLVLVPACRRASPIWVVPPLVTLLILVGTSFPHYRHLAVPFLVVLAAGGAVAVHDLVVGRSSRRAALVGEVELSSR